MAPTHFPTAPRALLLLALATVTIVLGLLAFLGSRGRGVPGGPEAVTHAAPAREADLQVPAEGDEPQAARQVPVRAPAEAPASAEPVAAPVTPAAEPPVDRNAKGRLVVKVVDRYGTPVPQARVEARGWRTTIHPGDWYSWDGPEVGVLTDLEGIAVIEHARWSAHGGDWFDVAIVCFTVEHAEYVSQDLEVEVAEETETTVTLARGAFLFVSGWIGSPAERIAAVEPHVSADVEVGKADWIPLSDGRPSCSRIPPGDHALYLTCERADETWSSDVLDFTLAEEEQKELSLELHPPRDLAGVLDPAVPRPIVAGEVELNLYHGGRGNRAVFLRTFRATVAADGAFRFVGLPLGAGEMIGMCEGWASSLVDEPAAEATAEAPLEHADGELGHESPASRQPHLQQVPADAFASDAAPFVLRMEPTARVEITVEDPSGEPLEGATVVMWPNVFWTIGWSGIFLDREWRAVTDRRGVAVIENVPPRANGGLHVAHRGLRMPLDDAFQPRRQATLELAPGETTKLRVRMEPDEE
jgi:hypothetical protein